MCMEVEETLVSPWKRRGVCCASYMYTSLYPSSFSSPFSFSGATLEGVTKRKAGGGRGKKKRKKERSLLLGCPSVGQSASILKILFFPSYFPSPPLPQKAQTPLLSPQSKPTDSTRHDMMHAWWRKRERERFDEFTRFASDMQIDCGTPARSFRAGNKFGRWRIPGRRIWNHGYDGA